MSASSWQLEHRLSCHLTSSRTCFSLWSFIHSFWYMHIYMKILSSMNSTWGCSSSISSTSFLQPHAAMQMDVSVSSVEAPARWCSNMLHVLFLRSLVKANKLSAIIWCLFLMINSVASLATWIEWVSWYTRGYFGWGCSLGYSLQCWKVKTTTHAERCMWQSQSFRQVEKVSIYYYYMNRLKVAWSGLKPAVRPSVRNCCSILFSEEEDRSIDRSWNRIGRTRAEKRWCRISFLEYS